ncbi:MAG: hypothetical protein V4543_03580 [Bacteroidota bacterium]
MIKKLFLYLGTACLALSLQSCGDGGGNSTNTGSQQGKTIVASGPDSSDCSLWLEEKNDKMEGHTWWGNKNLLGIGPVGDSDDIGYTINVHMRVYDNTPKGTILINFVSGKWSNEDSTIIWDRTTTGSRILLLFTDNTRVEFKNLNPKTSDKTGLSQVLLNGGQNHNEILNMFKEKDISAIRIYTADGYTEADLSRDNQRMFEIYFNCLMNKSGGVPSVEPKASADDNDEEVEEDEEDEDDTEKKSRKNSNRKKRKKNRKRSED